MEHVSGVDAIVEVGPHAALQGPTLQTLSTIQPEHADMPYISLANRKYGGVEALALAVGSFCAYLGGRVLDISSYVRLFSPARDLIYLPDYSAVPRLSDAYIHLPLPVHPLLGATSPETGEGEWRWRNCLRPHDLECLDAYRVQSQTVFPATGYITMALEASQAMTGRRSIRPMDIHGLAIDRTMTIPDDTLGVEMLFTLSQLDVTLGAQKSTLLPPKGSTVSGMRPVDSDHFYDELSKIMGGSGHERPGSVPQCALVPQPQDVAIVAGAANSSHVAEIIADGFRGKLRHKLHLPGDSALAGTTLLTEVGVDSLVAVDLRMWFVKELGVDVPVLQLLGGSSIDVLAGGAADRLDPGLVPLIQTALAAA
ncbi:hypothetical protein BO70DRAFT_395079 [Aspergillus heteromorphus CBS 117.55]|uniref:Uncharacterized protein n=1 Tax=Aspergillus heteromorphus CBS 117.55 TaxID=1448321 RepID=A0A317WLL6_9EURO|nr:uncharacterized protein BO70DRAFT_395079 [Aspergillus heteromorphus CBS 117.55]PWY85947.1 hypothetical protein BO70DRAFT_395079 [Aspergillus heteromorphus CBS 117.55]